MDLTPTPSQTVGPFFHVEWSGEALAQTRCIAGPGANGERLYVLCRVFDGDGKPVNDAMIEIWQADSEGRYNSPTDPSGATADPACNGFGRLATDESGACEFETIRPGRVAGLPGDARRQAPHMLVAVFARGMLKQLFTRIYFEGDPGNLEDAVLGLVPAERRPTLMARRDAANIARWCFDIHLQGEQETVFFDV